MSNNELQDLLSTRFEEYTHTTNESVWNAIESELDEDTSDRAGIWFWIFNGIAATLLVGLMIQSGLKQEFSSPETQLGVTKAPTEQQENKPTIDNKNKESFPELTDSNELDHNEITTSKSIQNNGKLKSSQLITNKTNNKNNFSKTLASESPLPRTDETTDKQTTPIIKIQNTDIDVAKLSTKPLDVDFYSTELSNSLPASKNSKNNYFQRLPIHIGFEFTRLFRSRLNTLPLSTTDSINTWVNNELFTNRQFEMNLFLQADVTRRLSISVGCGYSTAEFEYLQPPSNAVLSYIGTSKSEIKLLTVPVQAKFAFIKKNRFALSAGLSLQGEFGQISHLESVPGSWSVIASPAPLAETASTTTGSLKFQQFEVEPFLQLSIGILPRLSVFTNVGYRSYIGQSESINISPNKLQFVNADMGITFQVH